MMPRVLPHPGRCRLDEPEPALLQYTKTKGGAQQLRSAERAPDLGKRVVAIVHLDLEVPEHVEPDASTDRGLTVRIQ